MNKEQMIKQAVSQLFEDGKLDVVEKVFAMNYVAHAGAREYKGHVFIKTFFKQLRSAFSDMKVVKIEFLNESSNTITWQRTLSGKNSKNMKRIPASGKKIKWTEMIVSHFENEKISEEWIVSELMGELLLKAPTKK
ncbi:MAG TPA: ester cyclase [Leptospiraceae bacterium]|nr:ester cyclase [Leptospiraceae bacterium]HRG77015.1 ester cyclase [Leptospiraceae bacterium]